MNEVTLEEWVVARTAGGSYFGKVDNVVLSKVVSQGDEAFKSFKNKILDRIAVGQFISLAPCFDFMAPIRPQQGPNGMALSRDPVIVPFDFTTHSTPVYIQVQSLMFCGELQGDDKKMYKDFAKQVLDLQLRTRAQASGLELPGRPLARGKGG